MVYSLFPLIAGITLDYILGEPNKYHPLVGFGCYAQFIQKHLNRFTAPLLSMLSGFLALSLAVIPPTAVLVFSFDILPATIDILVETVILYFCIGRKSLHEHIQQIYQALQQSNLRRAQLETGKIVSRETHKMNFTQVRKAAIESILENGPDAILAPIFWFLLLGAPGALAYRLTNTLDAMWGYRTEKYRHFGYAAAKLDDILNWLPARLTALSYCVLGNWQLGVKAWRYQAPQCASPNAGPVMAAGAGALNIQLGGKAIYHGRQCTKPELGYGNSPTTNDLMRAVQLVSKTLLLWVITVSIISVTYYATQ